MIHRSIACCAVLLLSMVATAVAAEPLTIQIEKTQFTIQGHYEYISISKSGQSSPIAGFEFLIGYDPNVLWGFMGCTPGELLEKNHWQILSCQQVDPEMTGKDKNTGYLLIQAAADDPDSVGSGQPLSDESGALCDLKFYVTNDRNFGCTLSVVSFVWASGLDNRLWTAKGDTFYTAAEIREPNWKAQPTVSDTGEITGVDCYSGKLVHRGGPCAVAPPNTYKTPIARSVIFWNGGVDIDGTCMIDRRGDLNLNGIDGEPADARLYANFFKYGIGVFDIALAAQIAESDPNNDGIPLTVADLIYLLQMIQHDELPFPSLSPFHDTVTAQLAGDSLITRSGQPIAGIYAEFSNVDSSDVASVSAQQSMQLETGYYDDKLHVLLWPGLDSLSRSIPPGCEAIFTVPHGAMLDSIQVGDTVGNMLRVVRDSGESLMERPCVPARRPPADSAQQSSPIIVGIEKAHDVLPGHYDYLTVTAQVGEAEVAAFDLTIAYQPAALRLIEVASAAPDIKLETPNPMFVEYTENTGFMRILGHPRSDSKDSTGKVELAVIKFLVSSNREFDCHFLPVRFAWIGCNDNMLTLADGTLIGVDRVFDYEGAGDLDNPKDEITGNDCKVEWYAHYCGLCDSCRAVISGPHLAGMFWNGGVDLACADYDFRRAGDVNYNGIDNEIADLRLLAEALLVGVDTLHLSPDSLRQAADVNNDCVVASIADFVFMNRIISGDAMPFPKLAPKREEYCPEPLPAKIPSPWNKWIRKPAVVTPPPEPPFVYDSFLVDVRNDSLEISSDKDVAGVLAVFELTESKLTDSLVCLVPMQLEQRVIGKELHVLIWAGLRENLTRSIPAGKLTLFEIPKGAHLKFLQASDYNGNLLDVKQVTDSGLVKMPLVME